MQQTLPPDDATAPPPPLSPRQLIVRRAIDAWKRQLIDLGGRNNLLYFRDLRVGTLDLTPILGEEAATRLLEGRSVRLSQLFPDPERLKDAARRARAIRAKATENYEERGLDTLSLGIGMATWRSDRTESTPNAPVILYEAVLKPQGVAGEDFALEIEGDPEVNPTLLHLMETDFNVRIAPASLKAEPESESPVEVTQALINRVRTALANVPGFALSNRVVVANFSYAKLPMVRDLDRAEDEVASHALLSAIAGDLPARDEVRQRQVAADALGMPPVPPPADEFLILDADNSQSRVIAAAVAGSDLVVIGPPGTGKSQTISNLIATLAARGKSVLFVAEKRAAIEAVVERLQNRALGDLVLDLHDGTANRRRVAETLQRALEATGRILDPEVSRLHRQLERRREELEAYATQLHMKVAPWDISAFEAQNRILGIPPRCRTDVRYRSPALEAMAPGIVTEAIEDTRRFFELGGLRVPSPARPGALRTHAACWQTPAP